MVIIRQIWSNKQTSSIKYRELQLDTADQLFLKKKLIVSSPTVSTKMMSKLAASQTIIDSSVVLVTPPSVHLFGDDL